MHEDQDQEQFEQALRHAAASYNEPPPTPQRELWRQIQQARASQRARPLPRRRWLPLAWAAGIAATLAIGVGLGRWSAGGPALAPVSHVAASPPAAPPPNTVIYRVTAAAYLGQVEVFLTLFRMSLQRGAVDSMASATARPLLATNRLLLDSPAGADPKIRVLLEDLELVLAQIAQLSPKPTKDDLELITTGIMQTHIMTRLSDEAPAGIVGT